MGNKTAGSVEFAYSTEVDTHVGSGFGKPHRHNQFKNDLVATFKYPDGTVCTTLYENFQRGLRVNPSGNCLGKRAIDSEGKAGAFHWQSYTEISKRFLNFGAALHYLDLVPGLTFEGYPPMRLLGIYSKNKPEWVIAEQAANAYGCVLVPLYDTLGPNSLKYVLNQCEMPTMICAGADELKKILAVRAECEHLKTVIVMAAKSTIPQDLDVGDLKIIDFAEMDATGAQHPMDPMPPKPDDIATFCYTSGTTGDPKGAMLSHANIMACVAGVQSMGVTMSPHDTHLSYLPLPHMFERAVQVALLQGGAAIGFFQGDTLKIPDDIKALRPTIFPSVPRLFNRMYEKILAKVNDKGGMKAKAFNHAKQRKSMKLGQGGGVKSMLWDKMVFNKLQAEVGLENCHVMLTGSAPIARHVMEFLRIAFCNPVCEGYGQTECAAACTLTAMEDQATVGHVGGPLPCNEICLQDVEDMSYLSTDTSHNGEPVRGRGEVCIRGPNVFVGYFRNPEKTKEAIDEHGWLHSGDIGVWLPNGALRIVDRKKNIFKLAQGEYVAAEKIENAYSKSPLIEQIFIYGNSLQSSLVAVIVPDPEGIRAWATEHGKQAAKREDVVGNKEFLDHLQAEMKGLAKKEGLHGFEQPRKIHLSAAPFTVENDLLTPTFKLKRAQAQAAYQEEIDKMYADDKIGGVSGLKQGVH